MAKYRLPDDVKLTALSYVKGYDRRKREYKKRYNEIMNSTAFVFDTYMIDGYDEKGEPMRVPALVPKTRVAGAVGNPTERKALALEMLTRRQDTVLMRAVERALDLVGDRIRNEELREKLAKAVMLSCVDRYTHTYESSKLMGVCRTEFYAERRRFLWYVAEFSGLLEE